MSDEPVGCAKPTGKVVGETGDEKESGEVREEKGEKSMVMVKVGAKAAYSGESAV